MTQCLDEQWLEFYLKSWVVYGKPKSVRFRAIVTVCKNLMIELYNSVQGKMVYEYAQKKSLRQGYGAKALSSATYDWYKYVIKYYLNGLIN